MGMYNIVENHRVTDVSPKLKYGTDEQQLNPEGVPLWTVTVKMIGTDGDGDPASETIKIPFPSAREPQGLMGQKVETEGLEQNFIVDHKEKQFTVYYRARGVALKQKAGVGAEK